MLDTMPLPDLYAAEPIPDRAQAEVMDLLQTGDLFRYTRANSPVARLEQDFAAALGSRYALAVASCSSALFLALKSLGLPPGARVLIPAFTFAAVPSAVVHADCTPVLVEVDDSYRIDLDDFAAKLTADTGAVLISHMRGHTSDMDAICARATALGVPVIEDAAHSLGTTWRGQNIGTIGRIGCFSFQSYKMLNAGEGGMLVTDDPDLLARMVIMSGAYEHNWRKHPALDAPFARWQNRLPLYNTRLGNLSAVLIRAQLDELPRRVRDGRRNHDHAASRLRETRWFAVPQPLDGERRAPDSLQFSLRDMDDATVDAFVAAASARGLDVQVFGRTPNNARAFWNWGFLGDAPDLPGTRAMLARACDVRLPARLTLDEVDRVIDVLCAAAAEVA